MVKTNKKTRRELLEKELERLKIEKTRVSANTNLTMQIKQLKSEISELKKNQIRNQSEPFIKPLVNLGKGFMKLVNKIEVNNDQHDIVGFTKKNDNNKRPEIG